MIWSIQVLRFVAALMIVYLHAAFIAFSATGSSGVLPVGVADIGNAGVDIFFVISGLIIAKVAPGRAPSEFILSRIKRIVPMYFLLAIPAVAIEIGTTGFGWRDAVATFLFWPATNKMTIPALQVGWTLCFEMLFYACAALVLVSRRWALVLIGAYGVAIILRPIGPPLQFFGNPIILEFLLGVTIAYAPSYRLGTWALPFGAIWLIGANLIGKAPNAFPMDALVGHDGFQRVLILGIPSAIIVYGSLQIKARASAWTYLGDASYSLYLSHPLIIFPSIALWQQFPMPPDLIILICIFISLLFAWRIHERIEKPIVALLKRPLISRRLTTA